MKTITNSFIALGISVLSFGAVALSTAAEPPVAQQVRAKLVFTTPIIWIGAQEPAETDSHSLLDAIDAFSSRGPDGGFQALEHYINAHPHSPWDPSLHAHMAEHYRKNGRYSLAVAHWEAAWQASKSLSGPGARTVAARTLEGW